MLKMALFDCAINEKCCSVDGTEDRAFAVFFCPHPGGFDSSRVPSPGNLPSKAKKMPMPGGQPGGWGGGGWAQVELTDALQHFSVRVIWCFSLNLFSLLSEKNEVNELLPVNSLLCVVVK